MPHYRVYNRRMLSRINAEYLSDYSHEIKDSDIQFANKCIKAMVGALNSDVPKAGDVIQYTEKDGTYYPAAVIDKIIDADTATVCLGPFIPYVSMDSDKKLSFYIGGGGPWVKVSLKKLKYVGTTDKWCRFWGSSGVCAHGAIDFVGYTSCWEFKEEGLLYGEYSTKDYDRVVFSLYRDGGKLHACDNQWYARGSDPENIPAKIEDVPAWLTERKGKQFGDFATDDVVTVFIYKERFHLIDLKKWQMMDLPQSTRRINNSQVYVKLDINDETKTIDVYRYENKLGMAPWN